MEIPIVVATILSFLIFMLIIISICCTKPWKRLRYFTLPAIVYRKKQADESSLTWDPTSGDTMMILSSRTAQPISS
ncbi:Cy164.1 [Cynomolgus cytomegalovirus]|uniref:Uncharacterized protein n=2 Tax=Cytomegalovirus macacinebeta3 TaxID=3050308 RepID=A0A0K1H0A5_9BETA|nr:Cy164.1 [Cynomolgus cytomegalovirus]AFL03597.1 Rh164.1 [macacine betaherpesvirus 3]AKT72893.1 hypothetical protein [Cynomolgus macaque cytomegalovirus strain Mauritius]QMS44168.1 Rh167.1 [synthetic construct]QQL10451.1 Rh164.1 [macacine betaherpesvirus 3]QQL10632.1 Rh164.1 [Rhesus cytomegalovirus strain 68-1.2]QQL10817.1 Rh164.1 [Rhesus cytomegalovirus strain 68-1_FL]